MRAEKQHVVEFVKQSIGPNADNGLVLQHLISIQFEYGFIPQSAIELLSARLDTSQAEINGLISFYSFLLFEDPGSYRILISDNITDRFAGNRQLYKRLCSALQEQPVSIDFTSCIGLPDQGVGILINGLAINEVDERRLDEIIGLMRKQLPVGQWPPYLFQIKDNILRRDHQLNAVAGDGLALKQSITRGADWCLGELQSSGLRGRGGAGFPTARKWQLCRDVESPGHVVVCNADEGEPGTFKDRVLLNSDADSIIEGMTVCAWVTGATLGFIYLRAEYRYLLQPLQAILERRRQRNLLGMNIHGVEGFNFDIDIHLGAGAYICGEESALIESLEGKRGIPRVRPPFPVVSGYRGLPTVVNNVETFWSVSRIMKMGAEWFKQGGSEQSAGTRLISISGDCSRPGVYEYPFGTRINQILQDCGGEDAQAVQVSGAAGNMVFKRDYGRALGFEDLPTGGSFMVIGPQRSIIDVLANFAHFFRHESCGFCTPCRNGSDQLVRFIDRLREGCANQMDLDQFLQVLVLMQKSSFCGLGCSAPTVFLDVLRNAPKVFTEWIDKAAVDPVFDLDKAVSEFKQITGADSREVSTDA